MKVSRFISFVLDGRVTTIDFQDPSGPAPTTTVLNYLRSLPGHRGVKEGCAEGDCGACTVVLGEPSNGTFSYRAVDSCLMFLPMIHGKNLITVENLKDSRALHPVQHEMVETGGSQCGYCTPGIIMSLFSLYKEKNHPDREEINDALTGNLCRCTGYKPIVEAASRACVHDGVDQFTRSESKTLPLLRAIPSGSVSVGTQRQQYWRPATLGEALSLKKEHPDALVLCGATDIALRVTKGHELLAKIIDLGALQDLRKIESSPEGLRIGAGATLSALLEHTEEDFPAIADMLKVFGSRQIRNLATLGGNLGTASPIGDFLPLMMAYQATIHLRSSSTQHAVPIDEFITGYRKTVVTPEELIVSIDLPRPRKGVIVKAYKVSKRTDLDISTLSGAFRLTMNGSGVSDIRVAYGGMAETPKRAIQTEAFLKGKKWERGTVEQAMEILDREFSPISDARSGSMFRKVAAKNLLLKFWTESKQ